VPFSTIEPGFLGSVPGFRAAKPWWKASDDDPQPWLNLTPTKHGEDQVDTMKIQCHLIHLILGRMANHPENNIWEILTILATIRRGRDSL
jgi:hypothetical protein